MWHISHNKQKSRYLVEDLPVAEALTIHNGELSSDVKWIQFIPLKIKAYAMTFGKCCRLLQQRQ